MLTSVSFPKNVLCTSINWLKLSTCRNRFSVVLVLSLGCKADNRRKVTMQAKKKNEVTLAPSEVSIRATVLGKCLSLAFKVIPFNCIAHPFCASIFA